MRFPFKWIKMEMPGSWVPGNFVERALGKVPWRRAHRTPGPLLLHHAHKIQRPHPATPPEESQSPHGRSLLGRIRDLVRCLFAKDTPPSGGNVEGQ